MEIRIDRESVLKSVDELIPYEKNPRNNQAAIEYVKNSIKEFGFTNPIVIDKDNVVVCGHTRLKAAKRLGMTEVPCICVDDLTEEQVTALRLADNKVSEEATWNEELLAGEMELIKDINMEDFGFMEEIEDTVAKQREEEGEMGFVTVLNERHDYVVLYFKDEVDWIQAKDLFGLKKQKRGRTSPNGKDLKKFGEGRVIDGAKAIERIKESAKRE